MGAELRVRPFRHTATEGPRRLGSAHSESELRLRVLPELTFSEEILLLLLDDDEGIFLSVGKTTLQLAMAGSVLMELACSDRIDTDLESVIVTDRSPTGNRILDRILKRVSESDETRDARGWIETLSAEETVAIQEQSLDSLVAHGILRRDQKKLQQETVRHLWVFRSPRYFVVDPAVKNEVKARMAVLTSEEIPDPRDVILVCLLDACGVLGAFFDEEELRRASPRLEQLRKMDLIGREISGAIAEIERSATQAMAHPLA